MDTDAHNDILIANIKEYSQCHEPEEYKSHEHDEQTRFVLHTMRTRRNMARMSIDNTDMKGRLATSAYHNIIRTGASIEQSTTHARHHHAQKGQCITKGRTTPAIWTAGRRLTSTKGHRSMNKWKNKHTSQNIKNTTTLAIMKTTNRREAESKHGE